MIPKYIEPDTYVSLKLVDRTEVFGVFISNVTKDFNYIPNENTITLFSPIIVEEDWGNPNDDTPTRFIPEKYSNIGMEPFVEFPLDNIVSMSSLNPDWCEFYDVALNYIEMISEPMAEEKVNISTAYLNDCIKEFTELSNLEKLEELDTEVATVH
jgi:hypothetical protein